MIITSPINEAMVEAIILDVFEAHLQIQRIETYFHINDMPHIHTRQKAKYCYSNILIEIEATLN